MRKPVTKRQAEKGRLLALWRAQYPEAFGFELEWDDEVGVFVPVREVGRTGRCGRLSSRGRPCHTRAGLRTAHEGVGACWYHDNRVERAAGAWAVAHKIAQVMDITPWEALLLPVRRAAAWAAFYDTKLAEVVEDEELAPGGSAYEWVVAAERVNEKLARWSKMAVDAGVQQMLVSQAQTEGARILRLLNEAIAGAALGDDAEDRLREALRRAFLREATDARVIEASVGDPMDDPA